MNRLKVGNIILGEGIPKICVPLTGVNREALRQEAMEVSELPCQMIELRADYMMAGMKNTSFWEMTREILSVMGMLKAMLDKPVLFTIRTSREGGEIDIVPEDYIFVNRMVADSGMADMIDIEAFTAQETDLVSEFVKYAHDKGNMVLLSHHDFQKTPGLEEMVQCYGYMDSLGGDVIKLAVMPDTEEDTADLMQAAAIADENYQNSKVVAISMGELGKISRICAGQFGSVITFASGKKASAPGQIDARTLQGYLERYYK